MKQVSPPSMKVSMEFLLSNATCFKPGNPSNTVAPQHSALSTFKLVQA
ncbi:hypothetical protein H6G64_20630 [Calothrix sp. FACHB-156]|nr:hypothetical protein [Nostoc linckia FACHB-104]MBD2339379.1 hypothetical protein [Calothrix sp. FACHB-156]